MPLIVDAHADIAYNMLKYGRDYTRSAAETRSLEAEQHLRQYCLYLYDSKDKNFGNGRTIVKMVEEIIKNQNLRLAILPDKPLPAEILHLIEMSDVQSFDAQKAMSGGRKKLGFSRVSSLPGSAS